jgi:hypothetical protein
MSALGRKLTPWERIVRIPDATIKKRCFLKVDRLLGDVLLVKRLLLTSKRAMFDRIEGAINVLRTQAIQAQRVDSFYSSIGLVLVRPTWLWIGEVLISICV